MAEGILMTTDEEIDAAIAAATHEEPLSMAASVRYLRDARLLLICLKSGQRLALPVEDLEDIQGATDDDLLDPELLGPGTAIYFPRLNGSVYVPYLAEGHYGSDKWMEQLGRRRAEQQKAAYASAA